MVMWSTNTYKCLLLILTTSQLLLLTLFWKHTFPQEDSDSIDILKRSICDCSEETGIKKQRFNFEENSTEIASEEDLENDSVTEPKRDHSKNNFVLQTTSETTNEKDKPVLLVAIISAREYNERRHAVRETWLQDCDSDRNVICRFFTDAQDGRGDPIDNEAINKLNEESANNRGDLVLLNTPSGTNFALRLLALFEWANKTLEFDFLLRIDDDHFLCLDRLLAELPYRPRNRLYWGHVHCNQGIVRIDEGMMILTNDLVQEFLRDRDKLLCHKYGDQAMAMWIYRTMKREPVTWFGDGRVHHDPPASFLYEFMQRKEICHTYLSLHGSYPAEMRAFRRLIEKERRSIGTDYDIPPIVDLCPFRRDSFDWSMMTGQFHTMPRPCKDEPIWVSKRVYQGRTSNFLPLTTAPKQSVRINRVDLRYFGNKINARDNMSHSELKNSG